MSIYSRVVAEIKHELILNGAKNSPGKRFITIERDDAPEKIPESVSIHIAFMLNCPIFHKAFTYEKLFKPKPVLYGSNTNIMALWFSFDTITFIQACIEPVRAVGNTALV